MSLDALAKMNHEQQEAVAKLRLILGRVNEALSEAGKVGVEIELNYIHLTTIGDKAPVVRITAKAKTPSIDIA